MPRSLDRPQISIRLDHKTYYFLQLACRIKDQSISDVIRDALALYFTTIHPNNVEDFEEPYPGHELPTLELRQTRRTEAEAKLASRSLAALAELLWFEEPAMRLKTLAGAFPRLVTPDELKQLK